jgi:CRISPR-associated exonuclease Cas4
MGCYFLLIEEELRVRPPHGFIVLGDDRREKIDNTPQLRERVLKLADENRAARQAISVAIPVEPRAGQCRPCGMRQHCGQARV